MVGKLGASKCAIIKEKLDGCIDSARVAGVPRGGGQGGHLAPALRGPHHHILYLTQGIWILLLEGNYLLQIAN